MLCDVSGQLSSVVLSMYMSNQELPLPTTDEIFVCTAETSAEEVCHHTLKYQHIRQISENDCLFGHAD